MRIHPKKSLGQNFLIDGNIRRKILSACNFTKDDIVLEIGAGRGALTFEIAPLVKKLYAVEIDKELCEKLGDASVVFSKNDNGKLPKRPLVFIINKDILKLDLGFLKDDLKDAKQKVKVIGNIPYYISSPIIEHLINFRSFIDVIFLTTQKEFAKRLVSLSGNKVYGSLSCYAQYYFDAKIIFEIGRNCFFPVPKVDSSFLKLKVRENPLFPVDDEEYFFKLIRLAFNQRRKTLRNSLAKLSGSQLLPDFFRLNNLDPNIRAERLSLEEFGALFNFLKKSEKKD